MGDTSKLAKSATKTVNKLLQNTYVAIALTTLGLSQVLMWSFVVAIDARLIPMIDATFATNFFLSVGAVFFVAFIASHIIILVVTFLFSVAPTIWFRKLKHRQAFRWCFANSLLIKTALNLLFFLILYLGITGLWLCILVAAITLVLPVFIKQWGISRRQFARQFTRWNRIGFSKGFNPKNDYRDIDALYDTLGRHKKSLKKGLPQDLQKLTDAEKASWRELLSDLEAIGRPVDQLVDMSRQATAVARRLEKTFSPNPVMVVSLCVVLFAIVGFLKAAQPAGQTSTIQTDESNWNASILGKTSDFLIVRVAESGAIKLIHLSFVKSIEFWDVDAN